MKISISDFGNAWKAVKKRIQNIQYSILVVQISEFGPLDPIYGNSSYVPSLLKAIFG